MKLKTIINYFINLLIFSNDKIITKYYQVLDDDKLAEFSLIPLSKIVDTFLALFRKGRIILNILKRKSYEARIRWCQIIFPVKN